jgi:hypothetical protein
MSRKADDATGRRRHRGHERPDARLERLPRAPAVDRLVPRPPNNTPGFSSRMCARPSVTCSFQPSAVWTEWLMAASATRPGVRRRGAGRARGASRSSRTPATAQRLSQSSHSSRTASGGPIQKSRSSGAHPCSGGSLPHPHAIAEAREDLRDAAQGGPEPATAGGLRTIPFIVPGVCNPRGFELTAGTWRQQ